jgi:hypothetical protein
MKTEIPSGNVPTKSRWIRPLRLAILFIILYVVSIGPVFNLYRAGKISRVSMIAYRPLTSIKSPMFEFSRWYLMQGISNHREEVAIDD